MKELSETAEILRDAEMMESIRQGMRDIKAGRVKELAKVLEEEKAR
jgi:hypothetical protein